MPLHFADSTNSTKIVSFIEFGKGISSDTHNPLSSIKSQLLYSVPPTGIINCFRQWNKGIIAG
jgi:hypothetical protein